MDKHFPRRLANFIEEQKELESINVHKLKQGIKLEIDTAHHKYQLEILDKIGYVLAKGGQYLPEFTEVYFNGSTFGGTMIKVGWIGYGMFMEFILPKKKILTTTPVLRAKVIGENWEYQLEW
jgi:hypothetical protein